MLEEAIKYRKETAFHYQLNQDSLLFLLNKWDTIEAHDQESLFNGIFTEIKVSLLSPFFSSFSFRSIIILRYSKQIEPSCTEEQVLRLSASKCFQHFSITGGLNEAHRFFHEKVKD